MRITYLCLKNFASIFTSMKKKKLEIDFSKAKNKVIILVGKNGSGKTSILSNLHPFANPGNMDIRNNEDLILDGHEGYKEIHFINNDDKYIIKHHYSQTKTGRTIKSFISKNGVELNPNGLVTSFTSLIELEFGLELNYLKLLRLGSNVTGFIDEKTSDRKKFASDLLSDIDIFTQFFKKVNDDSRYLKSIMKNITDKLDKLKVNDEKEIKEQIDLLENNLKRLNHEKDELISSKWKLEGSINALIPEGVELFFSYLNEKEYEYKELNKNIKIKQDKLEKTEIIIIGSIDNNISAIDKQIGEYEKTLNTNVSMINFYFTQLEKLYTQRDDKTNNLKYLVSDLELSKLNDMYLTLQKRKLVLDKQFKDYVPKCSKDDMMRAYTLLQDIDSVISDIYTFDNDQLLNAINLLQDSQDVDHFVKREVGILDNKIAKIKLDLLKFNSISQSNDLYVIFKPSNCKVEECPYINYYKETCKSSETPEKKLKAELEKLENRREKILSLLHIVKNIDFILFSIKTNSSLIKSLPENFFDINNILESIKKKRSFYDTDKVTSYITILEDYDEYKELQTKIKEVKKEITFIEKNMNSLQMLQKELNAINNEIYDLEKNINKMKKDNQDIEYLIDNYKKTKEIYIIYKETIEDIDQEKQHLKELTQELTEKQSLKEKLSDSIDIIKDIDSKIVKLNNEIKNIENEITNNKFKLRDFISLNKEKALLEEKFDEINLIKRALSTNEGIPLLFIQLYFKNTKMIVNNLLDTVYQGTLEIDDFEITDKEFKIPYFKNGIGISDVMLTSQGEKSFVSLALSFALIIQSLKNYNIMLLDEIDATLDQTNRLMFLSILEKQIEAIGAEQVFLITHNNMFDTYPVDVILTSDHELDNYKNMNLIYK